MQTEYLRSCLYHRTKKAKVDWHGPQVAHRLHAIRRYEAGLAQGLGQVKSAEIVGISRTTLGRWKRAYDRHGTAGLVVKSRRPKNVRQPDVRLELCLAIKELRQQHPTLSKKKLTPMLKRRGFCASESTVGRHLSRMIGRGEIKHARLAAGRKGGFIRRKPPRPHAQRLKRGQRVKGQTPGQVMQLDHMTVSTKPGHQAKHFNAVCFDSRWNVANVYSTATARNAARFLEHVIEQSPFAIKAFQVDGGSEFMAEFEEACQDKGIPLFVLWPKSPKLNGRVERLNGTWRNEFYDVYDLPHRIDELRALVQHHQDFYNWDRPHEAHRLKAPEEYLSSIGIAA